MLSLVQTVTCLAIVCLSLAGSSWASEEHIEVAFQAITLKDVCSNRQVPVINIAEVRRLINELKADQEQCLESYRQSIYELEPVLTLGKSEKLCSERKFQQISDYHFRYVNPKVETWEMGDDLNDLPKKTVAQPLTEAKIDYTVQLDQYKQEIMIPITLQQFFKAWTLQVSGLCKRALVDNLERAEQTFLTESDLELIDEYANIERANVKHPVTKQKLDGLDFHNIVYMPELEGEQLPGDIKLRSETTILDFTKEPEVDRLMHACVYRYKPIYDKLIMPVVRLAKLGYDYQGSKNIDIDDKLRGSELTSKWLAITSICESQGKFELTESEHSAKMEKIDYEPTISYSIDGDLWIKGSQALAKEFNKIHGHRSSGFKRFLFESGVKSKKVVAFFDPHQFAWYRRNQNTLSSFLNSLSISSNLLSVGITLGR